MKLNPCSLAAGGIAVADSRHDSAHTSNVCCTDDEDDDDEEGDVDEEENERPSQPHAIVLCILCIFEVYLRLYTLTYIISSNMDIYPPWFINRII